ncbi:hypothetical protein N9N03_01475 [Chlamydiia bacterium]|nr:hypothetical protein [Chlamydiia bacterium]
MFGLKPNVAGDETVSDFNRSSTSRVEPDLNLEKGFLSPDSEVRLIKTFLVNLTDLIVNDSDEIVKGWNDLKESRHKALQSRDMLHDEFVVFVEDRLDKKDIANLEKASINSINLYTEVLMKLYSEVNAPSEIERVSHLKTVLNFFNLSPTDIFLRELDKLIVDEIAYLVEGFGIIGNITSDRSSLDFDNQMDEILNGIDTLQLLVISLTNEMVVKGIPIETIIPVLANSPDIVNDEVAHQAIFAFLTEHGREIKGVINDFIDNSNELNQILLILDNVADFVIKKVELNELSRQLLHLEKLLQRIIDLPHDEINYDSSINSGLTLLVDFINHKIRLDGGDDIQRYTRSLIKQLDLQLRVINMLFDKDNAIELVNNANSETIDMAMLELFDAHINTVKLLSKMPKTTSYIHDTTTSVYKIVNEISLIVGKIDDKLNKNILVHINKIDDKNARDVINEYLIIKSMLTERVADIYLETVNE